MEKKTDDFKSREVTEEAVKDDVQRLKEKVIYKVVPVPYYYPVPVDAEWYYKNYEPPMRNGERGYHGYPEDSAFENFPFPPPPAYGFPGSKPGMRETHYSSSRDEDDRYLRPVSPLYRSTRQFSPKHVKENSTRGAKERKENGVAQDELEREERENTPRSSSVKSEQHHRIENEELSNGKEEEHQIETSKSDGEQNVQRRRETEYENGSNSDSELSRKRKRFPMTFPYDQRKKNLLVSENGDKHADGGNEDEDEEKMYENSLLKDEAMKENDYKRSRREESESRLYSSHKYSSNGSNSHYPYVMVPVRSPPYREVARSPRYTERNHGGYYESRIYEESYKDLPISQGGRKEMLDDDDKREIRYHPNGRRARTVFTRQQLLTLNNVFEKHPFVSGERMSELSDQLGLDRKIVKIWFQNKRQYARKKGSLVERNDDFYYEYQERYPASVPTMAEHWKSDN